MKKYFWSDSTQSAYLSNWNLYTRFQKQECLSELCRTAWISLYLILFLHAWKFISEKHTIHISNLLSPAFEGWQKVIFSVCSHLAGVPPSSWWGTPILPNGGYPILTDKGAVPPSFLTRGTPIWLTGGYLHLAGYPPVRTGWGYPLPPVRRHSSRVSTCYGTGCMPLASTQEDFLIVCILKLIAVLLVSKGLMEKNFWSGHISSQIWCYQKFSFWDEEMKSEMKRYFFKEEMKREMKSEIKS